MTDNELRRLSRKDLLEMLIELESENERLRAEIETIKNEKENNDLIVNNATSIAEASLQLHGVFEAADDAAKQYLVNIKRCNEEQQTEYDRIIGEAHIKAAEIIKNAEIKKNRMIKDADDYWKQLSDKLESFYRSHPGIKTSITSSTSEK